MTTLIYGSGNSNAPALPLQRSVRFRSSASAYFNRTPAAASNRQTWTWFGWVKRGNVNTTATSVLFAAGTDVNNRTILILDGTAASRDAVRLYSTTGGVVGADLYTTGKFRDPSAWYFIVVALDTTQATAADRLKIYVNGQLQALTTTTAITQNAQYFINNNVAHTLGREAYTASNFMDGYFALTGFVDGQQLSPTSFSYALPNTGWPSPIEYQGSYGTNGFYLTFNDISASTATGIGKDYSGNGNNWTPNNISLTAGLTYDSMVDVPTLTSQFQSNYCTLNPTVVYRSGNTFTSTNGNLLYTQATCTATTNIGSTFVLPYGSGKFYYEVTQVSKTTVGGDATAPFVLSVSDAASSSGTFSGYYLQGNGGSGDPAGAALTGVSSIANNDVIMVAMDLVNGSLYLGKNGTWFNSGAPASGTGAVATNLANYSKYIPAVGNNGGNMTNFSCAFNFGQQPFTYTPPSGYLAINTFNLPSTSTALQNSASIMGMNLYNGNSSTQTITNAGGFKPDLVWIKSRSANTANKLTDAVRGVTKAIITESTAGETTDANGLTAFNSNGFTIGSDSVYNNGTGPATYVAWQWLAGAGVTSSNTSGSITSTVCVNQSTGFSIVSYTGTGANATVGHGLNTAPSLIIIHRLNSTGNWPVYISALGNTDYILLNSQAAKVTSSTYWNNTSPTSSVFSIGTATDVNTNTGTYIAYCWAEVPGYSKISAYVGNASTEGPYLYCNFRPKWVLQKDANLGTGAWGIYDAARNVTNPETERIIPNATQTALNDFTPFDFVANGLKVRVTTSGFNATGNTNIVMLFAENPFKYAVAR